MLRKFIKFLFYNEQRSFVQKNVLLLMQLSLLYFIVILYNIFFRPDYNMTFSFIGFMVILVIWVGVKKYGIFYSRLAFIIMVPLFNWLVFDSIRRNGALGAFWSFPVICVLFFCFYKRVALLAVGSTFVITLSACGYYAEPSNIFRVFITTLMVIICFTVIFFNFDRQYYLLQDKVIKDPLTKLLNRSLLEETLSNITEQPINQQSTTVILCFDLDNFKYINDTFGHNIGDRALINLAKLLKKNIKSDDKIFRLGGEEFLAVLHDISIEEAKHLAEIIRSQIEQANLINNNHIVTSSVGMAVYKQDENWNQWLKRADDAMYQAKQNGKNQVVFAD